MGSDVSIKLMRAPDGARSVHGTALKYGPLGVLIVGSSGSGKSRLAAQALGHGAQLIADDLVLVKDVEGSLILSAVAGAVSGLQLDGFGIVPVSLSTGVRLSAVVELARDHIPEPVPPDRACEILQHYVPALRLRYAEDIWFGLRLWLEHLAQIRR